MSIFNSPLDRPPDVSADVNLVCLRNDVFVVVLTLILTFSVVLTLCCFLAAKCAQTACTDGMY
jgi:hypothetical protein